MEMAIGKSWILGVGCPRAVDRLWERYHSLSMDKRVTSFSEFRLTSLGAPKDIAKGIPAIGPSVITDPKVLDSIESHLKDEHGNSLRKIVADDINSRILVNVDEVFPEAVELTKEALSLLDDLSPWMALLLRKMIPWIIPIYHEKYGRAFRRGFSHMELLGAIFTTFAERKSQPAELRSTVLAIDLAHELGHQVLMLYQMADRIIESPLDAPVYSSVRKTNRPAIMALHACTAAAYMMEICEAVIKSEKTTTLAKEFAQNSLIELQRHQRLGLDSLKSVSTFSPVGKLIVEDLERQIEQLAPSPTATVSSNSYFGLLAP